MHLQYILLPCFFAILLFSYAMPSGLFLDFFSDSLHFFLVVKFKLCFFNISSLLANFLWRVELVCQPVLESYAGISIFLQLTQYFFLLPQCNTTNFFLQKKWVSIVLCLFFLTKYCIWIPAQKCILTLIINLQYTISWEKSSFVGH